MSTLTVTLTDRQAAALCLASAYGIMALATSDEPNVDLLSDVAEAVDLINRAMGNPESPNWQETMLRLRGKFHGPRMRLIQPRRRPGQAGIQCLRCGHTSWNPNDVENHYCGYCHEYGTLVDEAEEDHARPQRGHR